MVKMFGQMLGFRTTSAQRPAPAPKPAPRDIPLAPPPPDSIWQYEEALLRTPHGASYDLLLDTYFQARHFVRIAGTDGPIHEHTFRVQINCVYDRLKADEHVTIGYREVREALNRVVGAYDARLLNDLPPFQRIQPTAEVLSHLLFLQLRDLLQPIGVTLTRVTLWESPTVSISYSEAA